jgi:hypothetical protein
MAKTNTPGTSKTSMGYQSRGGFVEKVGALLKPLVCVEHPSLT